MRSSLGDQVDVEETTGDLKDWFEMTAAARHLWEEDFQRKVPRELEGIRKALEKVLRSKR